MVSKEEKEIIDYIDSKANDIIDYLRRNGYQKNVQIGIVLDENNPRFDMSMIDLFSENGKRHVYKYAEGYKEG